LPSAGTRVRPRRGTASILSSDTCCSTLRVRAWRFPYATLRWFLQRTLCVTFLGFCERWSPGRLRFHAWLRACRCWLIASLPIPPSVLWRGAAPAVPAHHWVFCLFPLPSCIKNTITTSPFLLPYLSVPPAAVLPSFHASPPTHGSLPWATTTSSPTVPPAVDGGVRTQYAGGRHHFTHTTRSPGLHFYGWLPLPYSVCRSYCARCGGTYAGSS